MGCVQVNNCSDEPDYPCFETEQKCKCGCAGSGVDPESDECKCLDTKCTGGTIDKKDGKCTCRCPAGKFLRNGACVPFSYNCNPNTGTCYAVRGNGAYATQQACNANCGSGPHGPPCFPVPLPPAGTPLLCPSGFQYGLIMYTFDPATCSWTPFQIIWGTCPPPGPSSSTTTESSSTTPSSSSSSCDCTGLFSGVNTEIIQVCGQNAVSVSVNAPATGCGGGIVTYEYCDTCKCSNPGVSSSSQGCGCATGAAIIKNMTILIPCVLLYPDPDTPCAFCPVPPPKGIIADSCPEACPSSSFTASSSLPSSSSSRSSSSVSSASSSSCAALGATSITFSATAGTGQYLNKFGPGDFINVNVVVSDEEAAEEAQTVWTFFARINGTEYAIEQGQVKAAEYPIQFSVSSETLLGLLGYTFSSAPPGYYVFPMCARSNNCTGLTAESCNGSVTVIVTGNQTNTSSSSGTTTSSSTIASGSSALPPTSSSSSTLPSASSNSTSGSRTFYFVGTTNTRWDVLSNWRLNSPVGPVPAALPTSSDNVMALAAIHENLGDPACVQNFTVLDSTYSGITIELPVYVSNLAQFIGGAILNDNVAAARTGVIHGNTVFRDFSSNLGGIVDGNAIFLGDSVMGDPDLPSGEINGTAEFRGDSIMANGTVRCNASFIENSARSGGTVYGTVTCSTTLACFTTSAGACNNTAPESCPAP